MTDKLIYDVHTAQIEGQRPFFIGAHEQKAVLQFRNEKGEIVGTMDFNGPEMKFTGEADEAARVFMGFVAAYFAQRSNVEIRVRDGVAEARRMNGEVFKTNCADWVPLP